MKIFIERFFRQFFNLSRFPLIFSGLTRILICENQLIIRDNQVGQLSELSLKLTLI